MKEEKENFVFQSMNGSGKTGAFGIPAVMSVDVSNKEVQVLVIANSRELIRQTYQTLLLFAKETGVTVSIWESSKAISAQIVVASPGFVKRNLEGKNSLNYSNLKLVIFDEADEIFNNQSTREQVEFVFVQCFT